MKTNQTNFIKLCLAEALIKIMENKPFSEITINEICIKAGIGRTTYYRHMDKFSGKEDLLVFKVVYDKNKYDEEHEDDIKKDGNFEFLKFAYSERKLFTLLNNNGLVHVIMRAFDELAEWVKDKKASYLRSFFIYAYFGVVYEWIKYGFDETPEEVRDNINNTIKLAIDREKKKTESTNV